MRVVEVRELERMLTIEGSGFTPGARVRLTVLGPEPWHGEIVAAGDGRFVHVEEDAILVDRGALVFAAEAAEFAVARTVRLAPHVGLPILADHRNALGS